MECLSRAQIKKLTQSIYVQDFEKDEYIFKKGDKATTAYSILSGVVAFMDIKKITN